jgi:hypothetical protein
MKPLHCSYLGSWIRIASWLFLFGLYAAHCTRLIIAGEVLSLPLYSLLLWQFADGMTLERTTLVYLVSYLAYLSFNVFACTRCPRPRRQRCDVVKTDAATEMLLGRLLSRPQPGKVGATLLLGPGRLGACPCS